MTEIDIVKRMELSTECLEELNDLEKDVKDYAEHLDMSEKYLLTAIEDIHSDRERLRGAEQSLHEFRMKHHL